MHHSARRVSPGSGPLSPGRPLPSPACRAWRRARRGRSARVGRAVHERRDWAEAPRPRRWAATLSAIAASSGGRRWVAAAVERQAWSLRVARPSEPRLPSSHQLTRPSPSAAPLPGPRTCANERVAPWPTRPTAARPGRPSRRGPDRATGILRVLGGSMSVAWRGNFAVIAEFARNPKVRTRRAGGAPGARAVAARQSARPVSSCTVPVYASGRGPGRRLAQC